MITIAKSFFSFTSLRRWRCPRLFSAGRRRRRQVTLDLINSSPHLLRDIGLIEGPIVKRRR